MSGNPAVTVPIWPAFAEELAADAHLPVGVQIVARVFEDHVALALARVVERVVGELAPPAL